ncbi:MAG: DUF5667 domain-containing protein [Methanocellales archaeon]|nr:DUF5667 domain-containing protein [Methanocellales archaeon]MDD3291445.1 DUF5667 domain-containing protein [Methanocellales archaeon]MDD5234665.1 DUF5667 domain-containing protein [Methanocellales archaeon]MDD5484983.1 DUF5667 domain-containing protein [Methanocellales archaeon]
MKSIVMRIVPIALIAFLILTAQPAAAADGPNWADPESPLYGLKIALENANEAFSFGKEARLEKQLAHAEARLAEAQAMGDQNRTRAMERAIERYEVKLGQINETVCEGNVSEEHMEHVMNMTQKHEKVLQGLLERIDNGTMPEQARKGIERALNNSIQHREQFEHRHEADYGRPEWADDNRPEWADDNDEDNENMILVTINGTSVWAELCDPDDEDAVKAVVVNDTPVWVKLSEDNETDEDMLQVTYNGTSVWAELCDPDDEDAVMAILTSGTPVWVELPNEDENTHRGGRNRMNTGTSKITR